MTRSCCVARPCDVERSLDRMQDRGLGRPPGITSGTRSDRAERRRRGRTTREEPAKLANLPALVSQTGVPSDEEYAAIMKALEGTGWVGCSVIATTVVDSARREGCDGRTSVGRGGDRVHADRRGTERAGTYCAPKTEASEAAIPMIPEVGAPARAEGGSGRRTDRSASAASRREGHRSRSARVDDTDGGPLNGTMARTVPDATGRAGCRAPVASSSGTCTCRWSCRGRPARSDPGLVER